MDAGRGGGEAVGFVPGWVGGLGGWFGGEGEVCAAGGAAEDVAEVVELRYVWAAFGKGRREVSV